MNNFDKAEDNARKFITKEVEWLQSKYKNVDFHLFIKEYSCPYDAIINICQKGTKKLIDRWLVEVKIRDFYPNMNNFTLRLTKKKYDGLRMSQWIDFNRTGFKPKLYYFNVTKIGSYWFNIDEIEESWGQFEWSDILQKEFEVVNSKETLQQMTHIPIRYFKISSPMTSDDLIE